MSVIQEREVFAYTKDHEFTQEEYEELYAKIIAADDAGNQEEFRRLVKLFPIAADVLKAFAQVYGREYILSMGYDMAQANAKFGEGWFDGL